VNSESQTRALQELKDFERNVSDAGSATYNARVGAYDDLILAVAIALWFATNMPTSSSGAVAVLRFRRFRFTRPRFHLTQITFLCFERAHGPAACPVDLKYPGKNLMGAMR
jgi:hypothetical protein